MGKFVKKPVVIEAEQWDGSVECGEKLSGMYSDVYLKQGTDGNYYLVVETLEGLMAASSGDWIITGVEGERYPCRGDIFAKTYERAE